MNDINLALTAKGQALMAKISLGAGTIPLEITRIVTSSQASPDPLNSTALVEEQQEFTVLGKQTTGARSAIRCYLNNFGNPSATPPEPPLAQGYSMVQIGFYANDPDEGEILMRISQFGSPNYVPAANERAWEFEPTFNFVTGNASEVIIEISPTDPLLQEHIDTLIRTENGVHGLRLWGGNLQYWDIDLQEWVTIQTGGNESFGVGHVTELRSSYDSTTPAISLSWNDPFDLIFNGVVLARWQSTTVVRKQGGFPESVTDGTVVAVISDRNQHDIDNPLVDTDILPDEDYYYTLYPMSTGGIFNTDSANRIHVVPSTLFDVPATEATDANGNAFVFVPAFNLSDVIPNAPATLHPAFIVNGSPIDGFWCSKYVMSNNGGVARSVAGQLPWVSITLDNAKAACEAMGAGYHMITNAEWSAIALWCKARGFMPDGNNQSSAAVATGSNNPEWYHNNDLSGIEGLNGNVREWCTGIRLFNGELQIIPDNNAGVNGVDNSASSVLWRAIMPDGTLVTPGTAGTVRWSNVSTSWTNFSDVLTNPTATGAGAYLLQSLALIPEPGLTNEDYDEDGLIGNMGNAEYLPYRGGTWTNGVRAGVFCLRLDYSRTATGTSLGFRSAFIGNL
jgi:hypothetical protein